MDASNEIVATDSTDDVKPPKNCKENRYYYRHREEILEKKRQKRLEDPEIQAKLKAKEDERQRKKAEREELERKRAEKRELRKKFANQVLNQGMVSSGVESD